MARYALILLVVVCLGCLMSCNAPSQISGYAPLPDLATIDFLRWRTTPRAIHITPVALRMTYDPQEFAEPRFLGAWSIELDLGLFGLEEEVLWASGALMYGFLYDPGRYIRIEGPADHPVELAPSLEKRGYKGIRINLREPGFYVERLDRARSRVLEPVSVGLTTPPPNGVYRVQLVVEGIRRRISSLFPIDPTSIIVDDRWHSLELSRDEYLR